MKPWWLEEDAIVQKILCEVQGTHPSGVTGISVECGIAELATVIPHRQISLTTVDKIRQAGGDVIRTSGRSLNHATVTGLTPKQISLLLTPTIPNPDK
jgi:hypothetical protein